MIQANDHSQALLRRSVYLIFIALGTGLLLGRILAVDSIDWIGMENTRLKEVPRILAKKEADFKKKGLAGKELEEALAEKEEQLLEHARLRRPFLSANDRSRWCTVRALVEPDMRVEGAPYAIDKVIAERGWDTIDMVKHDGHLYSSKPPLFPTLLAGEYWVIHRLTGYTLGTHPYEIGRFMLVTVNVLPLVVMWLLLARLVERFGTSDWGRFFVMAAATFGTFLSTFAVVINNHLPGAVCAAVALHAAVRIWFDEERRVGYFVVAGAFAALTATNELPALSLLAALGLVLLWKAPKQTLLGFLPGVLLVAATFFATQWIAHHDLRLPYMHRTGGDNWYDYTYEVDGRVRESYWRNPSGLDQGETSTAVYALHSLVGHHGIFSLTPVWLLSIVGLGIWLIQRQDRRLRELAILLAGVSLVCLFFFVVLEKHGRNYGGMTSGFRWVFWMAPLWLVAMLPAADAIASRKGLRALGLILLALSVLSVSYPTWNPWTHPWLYTFLHYLGWIS